MQLDFELKETKKTDLDEVGKLTLKNVWNMWYFIYSFQNVQRATRKINYFGDIVYWCNETDYSSKCSMYDFLIQYSQT